MNTIETLVRGVCVKDNHILVYQNTNFGYVCLPGGHVEFWEPMTEALRREWNEEVGCDCEVGKFLNFFEELWTLGDGYYYSNKCTERLIIFNNFLNIIKSF